MTISYLIHSLREAGTTVQAINYCKGAAKAGTDITLVTLFEGGAFNQTNIARCDYIRREADQYVGDYC